MSFWILQCRIDQHLSLSLSLSLDPVLGMRCGASAPSGGHADPRLRYPLWSADCLVSVLPCQVKHRREKEGIFPYWFYHELPQAVHKAPMALR